MRTLHACLGHGGGALASLILGHPIVGGIEIDQFAREVIYARQLDGILPAFPLYNDLRAFDGYTWRGKVDLFAGGIPCQGFSGAGKGLGEFDPRNLWPDALRVLKETAAPWFFLENVDRLTTFDYWGVILQDLAAARYDARWCVLAAGDVGAPHRRKRIWCLATNTDAMRRGQPERRQYDTMHSQRLADPDGLRAGVVADTDQLPSQQRWAGDGTKIAGGRDADRGGICQDAVGEPSGQRLPEWSGQEGKRAHAAAPGAGGWPAQPDVGRMADGLPDRLDGPGYWAVERGLPRVAGKQSNRAERIRGLGNAQVPLAAATAYRLLGGP